MNAEAIVYQAMETVTGVSREDFAEYQDTNLVESGILDSLSIVSLLAEISSLSGKKIGVDKVKAADFASIGALIDAMKAVL